MTLNEFIGLLAEQFDSTSAAEITPTTKFKELSDWSSLTALSVIAMVDEECGKSINSDIIKNSQTIEELYNHIFR